MQMNSPQSWTWRFCVLGLSGVLSLLGAAGISALAQAPSPTPASPHAKQPAAEAPPTELQAAGEKAWGILREGMKDGSAERRAKAVRALGLLPGNAEAENAAINALHDKKPNVRVAAAAALGSMQAQHAKLELEGALLDSEQTVALGAGHSLLPLHDYVDYDILTGERRANKGLIKEQLEMLKDKKKLAKLGFEEGIGFIPFAGMGYEAFKTVAKNDFSRVRAAAAKQLAHDPDPGA